MIVSRMQMTSENLQHKRPWSPFCTLKASHSEGVLLNADSLAFISTAPLSPSNREALSASSFFTKTFLEAIRDPASPRPHSSTTWWGARCPCPRQGVGTRWALRSPSKLTDRLFLHLFHPQKVSKPNPSLHWNWLSRLCTRRCWVLPAFEWDPWHRKLSWHKFYTALSVRGQLVANKAANPFPWAGEHFLQKTWGNKLYKQQQQKSPTKNPLNKILEFSKWGVCSINLAVPWNSSFSTVANWV